MSVSDGATLTIQGVDIPKLALGTFGLVGDQCRGVVADAIAHGYRHIDTAQSYRNEGEIGSAIARPGVDRDQLFVTTKISNQNRHPAKLRDSLHNSLEQLKTDYVDLLLIHWPGSRRENAQALEELAKVHESGLARLIGVSNFTTTQLRRATQLAPISCNQIECHPLLPQEALFEASVETGTLVAAHTPLGRGRVLAHEALQAVSRHREVTPAQAAISWLFHHKGSIVVAKASSLIHLQENLAALDIRLPPEELDRIESIEERLRINDPEFAPEWDSD